MHVIFPPLSSLFDPSAHREPMLNALLVLQLRDTFHGIVGIKDLLIGVHLMTAVVLRVLVGLAWAEEGLGVEQVEVHPLGNHY